MDRCKVTMKWPMRYVGVWCVFGTWTFRYTTLKEAICDPNIEIVCVYTNQVTLTENPTLSEDWGLHSSFCVDESWSVEKIAARVLESLREKRPFCGAICFNEAELPLANQLNEMLGAPTPPLRALRRLIDKHTFYTTLRDASLPMVHFHTWKSTQDLEALLASELYRQGYYVLKPVRASDSAGVYRSLPDEAPHTSVRNYRILCRESARIGLTALDEQPSLIMEYIDYHGTPVEVTADGLIVDGEVVLHVVHEKLHVTAFAPFFDKRMVAPPLSPDIYARQSQIAGTTRKLVSALQLTDGVFHLEYRLTEKHCIPIDFALRPGGGFIPHAIYALTGVDLILAHVESHFDRGRMRIYPQDITRGTCIGALYAAPEISGALFEQLANDLRQQPGVLGLYIKRTPTVDPRFTVDAGLSLGVVASTPTAAYSLFEHFIQPYAKMNGR